MFSFGHILCGIYALDQNNDKLPAKFLVPVPASPPATEYPSWLCCFVFHSEDILGHLLHARCLSRDLLCS